MESLSPDFNLPIIISDYDAILAAKNTSLERKPSATESNIAPASSTSSTTNSPVEQNVTLGFADFADELWSRMTHGMKTKLREACVEVLKRTEDNDEEEKTAWVWDEDARFLD
ncbi:hypothetical protein LTR08_003546 [Meristemomyces frigidus]|nr:hypothetical protein LTR08_003546 [Meristemomyces frigidus]